MIVFGKFSKTSCCFRMAVCIWDIWFYVKNRRTIQKVGPANGQYRSLRGIGFHFQQLYAGKPQRIGPERAAGGKHPHAGIAAQPRRAHGGAPVGAILPGLHHGGKLPHQPDIIIPVQPAHRIRAAELRFKHNACPQFLYQPALPRNAEFFREVRFNMRDLRQRVSHLSLVLFLCPGMLLLPPQNPL